MTTAAILPVSVNPWIRLWNAKKKINNQIYAFQLHQRKRFPTRSCNIYSSFSFLNHCPWHLVLHNKKHAGMECSGNKERWEISQEPMRVKGAEKDSTTAKEDPFAMWIQGPCRTMLCRTVEDEKDCLQPDSENTHPEEKPVRQGDTILTVPLFNCTSTLGSTEQLKPEVFKLFGKGAWFCNWPYKDAIPLEQTYICRYKLFGTRFLRASLSWCYRRDERPLSCGFSHRCANQTWFFTLSLGIFWHIKGMSHSFSVYLRSASLFLLFFFPYSKRQESCSILLLN